MGNYEKLELEFSRILVVIEVFNRIFQKKEGKEGNIIAAGASQLAFSANL